MIDKFDELLRIIALEQAKTGDEQSAVIAMKRIMAAGVSAEIGVEKRDLMISRLSAKLTELSFGELVREKIAAIGETESTLAEKTRIPESVIADLLQDGIYTNNIPLRMMSELLSLLQISFNQAESAILSTFDRLKQSAGDRVLGITGFTTGPAFRKGSILSQASLPANVPADGKELFENREVLEKYLKRLKELTL